MTHARPASLHKRASCRTHVQSIVDVRPALRHLAALTLSGLLLHGRAQTPAGTQTLAGAQTPAAAQPSTSSAPARATSGRQTVFLDAAHGGDDLGAHLRDQLFEKDVTLALSNRLRFQLDSLGVAVLATRESEALPAAATPVGVPVAPTQPPTVDQRAGLANHIHPFACLVLHATDSGSGVHVVTADLPSLPPPITLTSASGAPITPPLRWETAQAAALPQSERLAAEIAQALAQAGLPTNRGHASIRPLNNLTCPAVLIELAPLSRTQGPANPGYQARVAQTLATALLFWHRETSPETASPRLGEGPPAP